MSHISTVKTKITDRIFLIQALKDLGFFVEEGDDLTVEGFQETEVLIDIKARIPLSYSIGFAWDQDHYNIVADWFGVRGLKEKSFTNQLMQKYAYLVTKDKLEKQGFSLVKEETESTGKIHLTLRKIA